MKAVEGLVIICEVKGWGLHQSAHYNYLCNPPQEGLEKML